MINHKERIVSILNTMSIADIKSAYVYTILARKEDSNKAHEHILSDGFLEVSADAHDGYLTPDGKEVYKFNDRWYVLNDEKIEERRQLMIKQNNEIPKEVKTDDTKVVVDTEKLSEYKCPKCSEYMAVHKLCGKCGAYRLGYTHKYICTCGFVFVTAQEGE